MKVPALTFHLMFLGAWFAYSQELRNPRSPLPADYSAFIVKTDPLDPNLAFKGVQVGRDEFMGEKQLLARDQEIERELSHGEHPTLPKDYASSQDRLQLIREAKVFLRLRNRSLAKALNSPEGIVLDPQTRALMEKVLAGNYLIDMAPD